jgi:hypothetical protein
MPGRTDATISHEVAALGFDVVEVGFEVGGFVFADEPRAF